MYDVFVPIHPNDSLTSLRDVLGRALADDEHADADPQLEVEGPESDQLVVRLQLDADDEQSAIRRARSIVHDALTAATVRPESASVGDPEVRSS
jgi:hypothetical protein